MYPNIPGGPKISDFSNFRSSGAPGAPTPIFCKLLFSTKFRGGAQIGVQQALSPLISLQIMTSAAQLTLIIDELLSAKCADQAQAFALLEGKGLLPAKLIITGIGENP